MIGERGGKPERVGMVSAPVVHELGVYGPNIVAVLLIIGAFWSTARHYINRRYPTK